VFKVSKSKVGTQLGNGLVESDDEVVVDMKYVLLYPVTARIFMNRFLKFFEEQSELRPCHRDQSSATKASLFEVPFSSLFSRVMAWVESAYRCLFVIVCTYTVPGTWIVI
jgi:hypothetical protein